MTKPSDSKPPDPESLLALQRLRIFEAFAAVTPDSLYAFDLEGRFLYANKKLLQVFGVALEEVIGKSLFELGCPEPQAEMYMRRLRQVIETKQPVKGEVPFTGTSGSSELYEYTFSPVLKEDGSVEMIIATTRDVTGRKEDERARAHMAAIVESSDDGILSKSLDGIIRSWNAGATSIFGYTAEEVIGRSILMLLPPGHEAEEERILTQLRQGKRIEHFESVRVTKDGRRIDVSLSISPLKDSKGKIIGASKIARDITRQKKAERELQAAKEIADLASREKDMLLERERSARAQMEKALRIKDEFLATLSHELRTPLNAMLGWSQVLRRSNLPQEIRDGITIIERNARVQAQIIEDLLDMSRIVSGKISLDVHHIDLSAVIAASIETVRHAAEGKGVKIITNFAPGETQVKGDWNRLQQVFWNLLSNGIKFTPKGGEIHITLERRHTNLEICVRDTGEGIPPEFLRHVFDRFSQADPGTNRRHGGLGLGLAIVKHLVELHGGSITVTSAGRGLGATFTVILPLVTMLADTQSLTKRQGFHASENDPQLPSDLCAQIAGIKILVVDDEPDARALMKRFLEDCKAIVVTASSSEEALRILDSEKPDVLVSDIGMPEEDGYVLIHKIRTRKREEGGAIPAIALTAYARTEDRMSALRAGFDHHVVKPVEPAELITLIGVLLRRESFEHNPHTMRTKSTVSA